VRRHRHGVNLTTLLLFTGQLSACWGRLHLARILTSLATETANKNLRGAERRARASRGLQLRRCPRPASATSSIALYVAVVRAGDSRLPARVLDTLTVYLEKTAQLRRKVVGAITYPASS